MQDLPVNKPTPELPWQRVTTNLFTFKSHDYLFITDSCSGFINFRHFNSSTCMETIDLLKDWFAIHVIPEVVKSDNGP